MESALATYWEFFEADRKKDAVAWAKVNSYPHIRVAATGKIQQYSTESEYAQQASWEERETTGWVQTIGIEPKIIHESADRVHLAGGWTRYNAEHQPILSNRVVYVLSRQRLNWGIQARFACGAAKTWQTGDDQVVVAKIEDIVQTAQSARSASLQKISNYPFILVESSGLTKIENKQAMLNSPLAGIFQDGIHFEIQVLHGGLLGSNLSISIELPNRKRRELVILVSTSTDKPLLLAASLF